MTALKIELRQLQDGLPKSVEKSHARDSGIPDSRHTTLPGDKSYKGSGAKPKQLKKTINFLGDDEAKENLNELTSRKQRVSSTPYINTAAIDDPDDSRPYKNTVTRRRQKKLDPISVLTKTVLEFQNEIKILKEERDHPVDDPTIVLHKRGGQKSTVFLSLL